MDVKEDMLHHLNEREAFYCRLFGIQELEHLRATLTDRSEPQGDYAKWFSIPECALLASNTYSVAIAAFGEQENSFYIPFFGSPISVRPLVLQLFGGHFYLIVTKARHKVQWPKVYPGYSALCAKNGFTNYRSVFFNGPDDEV